MKSEVGLMVFVTASFLIGIAPAGGWLIGGRALQGVGAAVVAPSALSLLTASFPDGEQRSRAVAWYAATAGIGASLGMLVGGAAAQWISWRAGFFINVRIGIAMMILAPRYLPTTRLQPGRFDLIGALAATVGVGALVFGILESADRGWTDPVVATALVVAVVVLSILVLHERSAEQPNGPRDPGRRLGRREQPHCQGDHGTAVGHRAAGAVPGRRRSGHRPRATASAAQPASARG